MPNKALVSATCISYVYTPCYSVNGFLTSLDACIERSAKAHVSIWLHNNFIHLHTPFSGLTSGLDPVFVSSLPGLTQLSLYYIPSAS
jgi:hypothetical protein